MLTLQCDCGLFSSIRSICFVEVSNIKSCFNARCSFSIACLASSGAFNSPRCRGFLAFACGFLTFTSGLLPQSRILFTLARVFFAAARIFFTLTNIVLATARFALSVRATNQFRNARFVGSWGWQIVKSTSECHGRCVSWRGLTTTATAAVSASIHHVIITIVIIRNNHAVRQIRKAWNRNARQTIKLNVRAAVVVGIHLNAIHGESFADANINALVGALFKFMKRIAARTQEHASNARAAHHLDARNAVVAEEQGDATQNVRSHCVGYADFAGTVTVRAVHEVRLVKTRAHALAGHLNHAEVRDLQRGGLGTIAAQIAFQARFNLAPVLGHAHVDQVVDDDSAQVAQAQLPGDFINGFTIGVVGVGLTIACTAALATVHIDRHHGFGLVNDQCSARRQRHFARVNLLNLPFNAERFEDWRNAVVVQKPRRVDRRHHLQEGLGAREGAFAVHHDGIDAVVGDVADGANQQIAFRVQGAGRAGGTHASLHGLPQALQINGVALQLRLGAVEASSAQNETEARWQFKAVQDAAHFAALVFVFHLAADAHLVHLRHHH